jgi:hypothetical protein
MSTDKPQSSAPTPAAPLLKDLPAQPVDEKEAEGIKGGSSAVTDTNESAAITSESLTTRGTP